MKSVFQTFARNISNLILALALSIAVWISAVSDSDPTIERVFPRSVPIDFVGKDPSLVLLESSASQVNLTLSAPQSIWDQLTSDTGLVRALVDLSEMGPGEHDVNVQIQISISPVRVVSYTPGSITVSMDLLETLEYPIRLVVRGEPAIGYQAGATEYEETSVSLSGPSSLITRVADVRGILDMAGATETIDRLINLQAVDVNGNSITDVTINPAQIRVTQNVIQLGGYRNVVVKVVTSGRVASGYRVTNISVFPPAVTVFSDDPGLVEEIPGYVETQPLDLTGVKDDLDIFLALSLPPGVTVVGDQEVEVQVGIAALEGSITLENMVVRAVGLEIGLKAELSPRNVDIILSGPIPTLDSLRTTDIQIVVNLEGLGEGVYQRIPQVVLNDDMRLQSILPGSIEVRISLIPTPTPTSTLELGEEQSTSVTPFITPTLTSTPTP